MGADRDTLCIDAGSSAEQLALAADILDRAGGVVVLENAVALRRTPVRLICEVLDPAPSARRCENEFEVLVENAQRILESSRLNATLPGVPRRWVVIDDSGPDRVELWRAPSRRDGSP